MENKKIDDKNHLSETSLEHVRYFLHYTVSGIAPCSTIVLNSLNWILYDEVSKRKSISIHDLSLSMHKSVEAISFLMEELVAHKLIMLDVVTHDAWILMRSRLCIEHKDKNSAYDGSTIKIVNANEPETRDIVTVAIL